MNPASILIGLAIMIASIPWVINPILNENKKKPRYERVRPTPEGDHHYEGLLALRDLEFDHRIGKVNEVDYANLKANLLAQIAASIEVRDSQKASLDEQIEEKIRTRRKNSLAGIGCSHCGAVFAASDKFCRVCGAPVDRACPKCGSKITASDRFCRTCGTRVVTQQENILPDSSLASGQ